MEKALNPCRLCHQNILAETQNKGKLLLCNDCKENPKHWVNGRG